jgi:hypothetical protein
MRSCRGVNFVAMLTDSFRLYCRFELVTTGIYTELLLALNIGEC